MISKIELAERKTTLSDREFTYYAPVNDETVCGTYWAIKEGDFKIDKIMFDSGDVIIDIGSNVCLFSCFVAKMFPFVKIYAFDANPLACLCARINRNVNNITNLEIFNKAIGAENRRDVKFYSSIKETSNSTGENYSSRAGKLETCDQISINEIFENKLLGINKIKYLKIDVEGMENEIINSMDREIIPQIEHLHLEIHSYEWAGSLKQKTLELFGKKWINSN